MPRATVPGTGLHGVRGGVGSSDLATQVLIAQCTEAEDLGLSSKSDTWEGTRDTGWDLLQPGCCAALTPLGPWGFRVSMHRF